VTRSRDKLRLAEEAEARARTAFDQAKVAVETARNHLKALEAEATAQVRLVSFVRYKQGTWN
jgi:predicted ArsR family transcriptional regulator